jgi:hypothetical protein
LVLWHNSTAWPNQLSFVHSFAFFVKLKVVDVRFKSQLSSSCVKFLGGFGIIDMLKTVPFSNGGRIWPLLAGFGQICPQLLKAWRVGK